MRMPLVRPRSGQAAQIRTLQEQVRRLHPRKSYGVRTRFTTRGVIRTGAARSALEESDTGGARWA